ncbi:MAG: DUF1493 family protein [Bacteroidia bacterium]|nr:DUF1493 family protein [Bacteroidia bacterium]
MNQKLIEFIVDKTQLKPADIKPETKLAGDIGFYGLDGILFFEEFFEKFNIQNLEEFDVTLHISGSVDFAPRPLNWIKNVLIKDKRKYLSPDVSMGHLEKVMDSGKWINEV